MIRRSARLWLAATVLLGGLYLGLYLNRGWYPHDEGALGQAAERLLGGEVPHRDFDEPYTGLLTYLHAAAFAIGGIRLPVLRIPLFLTALLWLVAVYRISLRSTGPLAAAAVTLTALAWSVPNYPASMPSWYNLFFATFGAAALLRWVETRLARWLVLAGIAGGVSFLFKLSGLFYVAGATLFLLYATEPESTPGPERGSGRSAWLRAGLTLGLLLLAYLLWRVVAPYYLVRVIYHFVAPGALIALALAVREWTLPYQSGSSRLRPLLRSGLPFWAGVLAPVAVFGIGLGVAGAIPAFLNGVFVAPFRRLMFASMAPPSPTWLLAVVPLAVLLRPRRDPAHPRWRLAGLISAALLAAVLWLSSVESFPYRFVWQSLRGLIPLLAAIAAGLVAWPRLAKAMTPEGGHRFVMLAMITAFASLIQFPFSAPVYFLYVIPLLLLALVALVQGVGRTPRPLAGATLAFYAAFAVLLVTPSAGILMGFGPEPRVKTVTLALPRAGLQIRPEEAQLYSSLIPAVIARAAGGDIWAGPDAPEVYFLGGFRNRSRALWDFLGGEEDGGKRFLDGLGGLRAVVINTRPQFSSRILASLMDSIRARFPEGQAIEHFELRWRR